MSDASTRHMIDMYMEEASAPQFLSGFFQSPPKNFHTSEKVELDIERDDEDVAVVITDLSSPGRENEATRYTNKSLTPPVFKEVGTVTAYDLIKRPGGQVDFTDPVYAAEAAKSAFKIARKLEAKIRRSVELMASQVLQTAALTLVDSSGTALYSLNFLPKGTHFPTVGTAWATNGSTGTPLADIDALAVIVRRDGKRNPNRLVFGAGAFQRFLANADVRARLDNRGMQLGQVAPETRGQGATFQGYVWVGQYRYEMWTYDGFYKHPQTGALTPYVGDLKVIMLSDGGRLDLTYGAIPRIAAPSAEVASFLPGRMSNGDRGLDLTLNAWLTENREHLKIQAGTRPLTIPTAIDTFGCLTVT